MGSYVLETLRKQQEEDARAEERAKALDEKKAIARKFRDKGIDLVIIAEATGLTVKQIQAL